MEFCLGCTFLSDSCTAVLVHKDLFETICFLPLLMIFKFNLIVFSFIIFAIHFGAYHCIFHLKMQTYLETSIGEFCFFLALASTSWTVSYGLCFLGFSCASSTPFQITCIQRRIPLIPILFWKTQASNSETILRRNLKIVKRAYTPTHARCADVLCLDFIRRRSKKWQNKSANSKNYMSLK